MWSTAFWKQAAERAAKTFAQSLVASLGVGAASPIWDLGWVEALGIAGTATVLSALTSVASLGVGDPLDPSLVDGGRHRAD
ncbi:holin [Corynebacterium lujinxingii]|uniref:Holin n=1 Tax=Corynebacterium lujinxingii TaxID=2763010 RepID=A0A7H0JWK9_9CORY|nr:holin [Corynebacterium lujinxingii]MBC3178930.1 holin [Corynebacterium lujinxingii]NNO11212.1 holin [Corynebacterium lujinxingii]QNP89425.1 holin [Corynebacterium lujinxingii]